MRLCIALALALCLSAGSAVAENAKVLGHLTKTNNSVTSVMLNAGCNLNWVSKVVSDSGIDSAKVRQLPIGQKISILGSCKGEPPKEVAARSALFLHGGNSRAELKVLTAENKKLREANEAVTKKYDGVVAENAQLRIEIVDLQKETSDARKAAIRARMPEKFNYILFFSSLTLGMAIATIAGYFVFHWLGRGKVSFPLKWVVKDFGKEYVFSLVGAEVRGPGVVDFVGKYKCPLCSEHNLFGQNRNLVNHLRKCHPQERIDVEANAPFAAQAGAS